MQNSEILDKTTEISKKAMERMQKEQLAPTPEVYELWYVYYSGTNLEITRAIDLLEKNKQKPTREQCLELYQRFLSDSRESETVRQAGDRIQETIKGITGKVSNVKTATSQYASHLEGIRDKLQDNNMSKQALEKLLGTVMTDTQKMMAHNHELEEELSKSSAVMDELRRDLENVRKEAFTDSLTGLGNRKNFDSEIERIFLEAEDNKSTFCLLMMDIDHFKSFNDNYGHQVGDQVLRLVSKTLTNGVKGRDVAARYGGEEFAIILPETNLNGGIKVGDMLRQAIAQKDVINLATGEKLGRITISGGVAEHLPGETIETLTSRADAALYTAKHNGRNQIAAAPSPGQLKAEGK